MGWISRLFTKDKFPGIDYVIKEAFTVAGRTFYEMEETINLPYERGVTCLRYYAEFNQRVDREYLLEHVKAIEELCKIIPGKELEIGKIRQINANLADRLNWIIDTDLAYKLASVVYFDKDENPSRYDDKYNAEKIEFWKKNMSAREFFFMQPLRRLIPFLEGFEENLEAYIQVTEMLKDQYLEKISNKSSKN